MCLFDRDVLTSLCNVGWHPTDHSQIIRRSSWPLEATTNTFEESKKRTSEIARTKRDDMGQDGETCLVLSDKLFASYCVEKDVLDGCVWDRARLVASFETTQWNK